MVSRNKRISLLVTKDVTANAFPENGGVAIHVQVIVLKLERQPHFLAEIIKCLGISGGGSSQYGTHLHGARHEDGSLQTNHLDIFFLCDIGAGFKVQVILLPLSNLQGRPYEEINHGTEKLRLNG